MRRILPSGTAYIYLVAPLCGATLKTGALRHPPTNPVSLSSINKRPPKHTSLMMPTIHPQGNPIHPSL